MAAPLLDMEVGAARNFHKVYGVPTRSQLLGAARRGAEQGWAVLPLRGKEPATPHGHKDASRDPARVTAMFNAARDATGYGIATGKRSGLAVLDVDTEEGLEEAKRRGLPPTLTVKTRRGYHFYLRIPANRELRSQVLAPGLELKAEGAYVVGPGSAHPSGERYTVTRDLPLGAAPQWVLERPTRNFLSEGQGNPSTITAVLDGPRILEGERDTTLTRIAGKLHDGLRTVEEIGATLMAINEARCDPPLPERQVVKIARSIHARPPCKPSPATTPEVLGVLDEVEAGLWRTGWRGTGELSARDVYVALIVLARQYGTLIPAGVRVSVSVRALALAAGVSKPTAIKAIRRLKEARLIRKDDAERSGTKAGAFVLLAPRANLDHSSTGGHVRSEEKASGKTLRTPRLRWSAPVFERVGDEVYRSTIRRLGKGCGAVIDFLERAGGRCTIEALSEALHKTRTRDLRRRLIARLEAAGVVECSQNTVSFTGDWLEALNWERELAGEVEAYRRDMSRYARERDAYRLGRGVRPDRAPSEREMRHRRSSYPKRRRDAITAAIARLFSERPEYRSRRTGQITCAIARYLAPDFPRGPDGYPKDAEVAALLEGVAA
jgi:hypothetical protein